jgi:hypothetical protein
MNPSGTHLTVGMEAHRAAGPTSAQSAQIGSFADLARNELLRRRANAQALVAQNRTPRAVAHAAIARWCSIAAWFGADLPDDLRVLNIPVYPVPAPASQAGQHQASRHGARSANISAGAPTRAQRDGMTPSLPTPTLFWDHAPDRTAPGIWLRTIAQQLREDTLAQLTRAEADPARLPRARALLALDRKLSLAAGLPPIFPVTPAQAGAQPKQEAA